MNASSGWRRAGGVALLVVGIALIPLPGPGWPVVFAALAILGVPPAAVLGRLPEVMRAWLPRTLTAPVAA